MDNWTRSTGQFQIDEILGQRVNPVEQQIFESRKGRARLLLRAIVWAVTIPVLLFTILMAVTIVQVMN